MENHLIIEIRNSEKGRDISIKNESGSINRNYNSVSSEHTEYLLGRVITELMGEPGNEEDEAAQLIEENDELFQEEAMKDYHGSKDGWENYYDNYLSNLTLSEVRDIIATHKAMELHK